MDASITGGSAMMAWTRWLSTRPLAPGCCRVAASRPAARLAARPCRAAGMAMHDREEATAGCCTAVRCILPLLLGSCPSGARERACSHALAMLLRTPTRIEAIRRRVEMTGAAAAAAPARPPCQPARSPKGDRLQLAFPVQVGDAR